MLFLCTLVYVVGLGLLLLFAPTFGLVNVPWPFGPQQLRVALRRPVRLAAVAVRAVARGRATLPALALWAAMLIVVTSLVADLALAWLDPRIRASGRPPG